MILIDEPINYSSVYFVDEGTSVETHVATDGVTTRHDFQGSFGTALGSVAVTSGILHITF